jgi:hypothetical protein
MHSQHEVADMFFTQPDAAFAQSTGQGSVFVGSPFERSYLAGSFNSSNWGSLGSSRDLLPGASPQIRFSPLYNRASDAMIMARSPQINGDMLHSGMLCASASSTANSSAPGSMHKEAILAQFPDFGSPLSLEAEKRDYLTMMDAGSEFHMSDSENGDEMELDLGVPHTPHAVESSERPRRCNSTTASDHKQPQSTAGAHATTDPRAKQPQVAEHDASSSAWTAAAAAGFGGFVLPLPVPSPPPATATAAAGSATSSRKPYHWSTEEHARFIEGLEKFGGVPSERRGAGKVLATNPRARSRRAAPVVLNPGCVQPGRRRF